MANNFLDQVKVIRAQLHVIELNTNSTSFRHIIIRLLLRHSVVEWRIDTTRVTTVSARIDLYQPAFCQTHKIVGECVQVRPESNLELKMLNHVIYLFEGK